MQKSLADEIIPISACDNPEQLRLLVGVESPRIVVQREEAVSIELLLVLPCVLPLLIINLCLLLEINIFIQSVIVKLRVLDFILPQFLLVGQEEVIHDLNSEHNLLLAKRVLNDDKSNIVLELLNGLLECVFRQAVGQDLNDELVVSGVVLLLQFLAKVLEKTDDFLKHWEEVKVFHFRHLEEHDKSSD